MIKYWAIDYYGTLTERSSVIGQIREKWFPQIERKSSLKEKFRPYTKKKNLGSLSQAISKINEEFNLKQSVKELKKIEEEIRDFLEKGGLLDKKVLESLKWMSENYDLALISNNSSLTQDEIKYSGILEFIPQKRIILSHHVNSLKGEDDKIIYQKVLDSFGIKKADANRVGIIGDQYEKDIRMPLEDCGFGAGILIESNNSSNYKHKVEAFAQVPNYIKRNFR